MERDLRSRRAAWAAVTVAAALVTWGALQAADDDSDRPATLGSPQAVGSAVPGRDSAPAATSSSPDAGASLPTVSRGGRIAADLPRLRDRPPLVEAPTRGAVAPSGRATPEAVSAATDEPVATLTEPDAAAPDAVEPAPDAEPLHASLGSPPWVAPAPVHEHSFRPRPPEQPASSAAPAAPPAPVSAPELPAHRSPGRSAPPAPERPAHPAPERSAPPAPAQPPASPSAAAPVTPPGRPASRTPPARPVVPAEPATAARPDGPEEPAGPAEPAEPPKRGPRAPSALPAPVKPVAPEKSVAPEKPVAEKSVAPSGTENPVAPEAREPAPRSAPDLERWQQRTTAEEHTAQQKQVRKEAASAQQKRWLRAQSEDAAAKAVDCETGASHPSRKKDEDEAAPGGTGRHRASGPATGPGGVSVPGSVVGKVVMLVGARGH